MISHKIYYELKPFIPRSLQIIMRRRLVLWKRKRYQDVWPIDERAVWKPEGWPGWPEQKQFALVLHHDVDTAKGHKKCHHLIEIEEEMGFRSSFNFVPERYNVSSELRKLLVEKGFEVCVHGLKHDGKLFFSKRGFLKQAERINHYLKEWKSVGFVSPSMHCNLDWISALDIEYDSSTFDTDPFEPQPDGMGTIFPFWVAATRNPCPSGRQAEPPTHNQELVTRNHELVTRNSQPVTRNPQPATVSQGGFIELPYTLPQDFTLFVLMKERNIDIWKRKLDWIAKQGGMALLITHPDYMNGKKKKCGIEEYPMEFYKEFLDYIKGEYEGQYWNPLPKEMAHFWKQKIVTPQSSK